MQMSKIIQSETFRSLDDLINDCYADAGLDPLCEEVVTSRQVGDHPTVSLARYADDEVRNSWRLYAGLLDIRKGSSHTQIHQVGLIATGSTIVFDEFGEGQSFRDTDDAGVLELVGLIKPIRDLGAFTPAKQRSVAEFFAGLRRN